MKAKLLALTIVGLMIVSGMAIVSADKPAGNGNGAPSGKHYNLNIIGVPNQKNDNFDGGNGARIFVLRDKPTQFYVHGDDTTSYEILDHDGTDGKVGEGRLAPGITFPYDSTDTEMTWQVDIYVRLVGPKDSSIHWKTEYWDGSDWALVADFNIEKSSKFKLETNRLLIDDYQDILWTLTPLNKFRNLQMRIYIS